ncbi:hypothetical protein IFM89_026961 [Coptis chinensis]|uniref:Uncharacterized protein n=1 Tax=Coptis chinensis TaxID=261450 RepID=A0A835LZT6_9MAGN|nr:hypothetical protein IFM89_026961 [Coptis chinensis]
MKLFFKHLDDPHHKVAQAALSTLAEMIPSCRKPFESYIERILPHVFSRLIDQKELVRQSFSTTLETVNKTYGIDSLLSALLRFLDDQRSLKAKLAVIEFAINSFNKNSIIFEGSGNSGILKLWLAKLAPLAHEKLTVSKTSSTPDVGASIPQILHQICNGSDENESVSKRVALQQLIDLSMANDQLVWSKYFNQILTVVLELLDDPDSSIRELALSLLVEMLNIQKDSMDDSVEVVRLVLENYFMFTRIWKPRFLMKRSDV